MDPNELLERYEALGELDDYLAAKPLFESQVAERPDAITLRQYGYMLECHGRITIRQAVQAYERAIALDPDTDKARYQWLSAKAALFETEDAIRLYRDRVAAAPGELRELRLLASAYLCANYHAAARPVIDEGLAIAPQDAGLIGERGVCKTALGDPEGALADWRTALELDPDDLSTVYSSAFLLEREGRLDEAAGSWRHIISHCDEHGWELTAVWPRQELQRLIGLMHERDDQPG